SYVAPATNTQYYKANSPNEDSRKARKKNEYDDCNNLRKVSNTFSPDERHFPEI
ncbi:24123_t:CDS:2, partial [Dentiscutata erythropus]